MIKTFIIKSEDLCDNLSPAFYLFEKKIKEYAKRSDIISFKLGDEGVLDVLTDGEHTGQTFVQSGTLFIKNSSVKRYSISEFDGFYITNEKNNQLKRSQLKKDDVLLTTIGNVGISAVVNDNLANANINQNVVRMRINPDYTTPQYLSCFLNSKITKFQVDNLFTGNIYPMLSYPKLKSLRVFVKDKDTEERITKNMIMADSFHTEALNLIREAQKIFLSDLKVDFTTIQKPLFYSIAYNDFINDDMITPSYYFPLYTDTINEIKNNNNWVTLGEIATFENGNEPGSNNYKGYLKKKNTDVPFIRTSDLVNYDIDTYPDYFIEKEICEKLNQGISPEEILFTKDGKVGEIAMTTKSDNCIIGSGILRIIPKKDMVNPYYLFIALSLKEIGSYQAKQRTVVASTIPHLREDRISDFVIPILEKQEEIIRLTEKAFVLKEKRKKLIDESLILLETSLDF